MDIQVTVKSLDGTDVIHVENVLNRNGFNYKDNTGGYNHVDIGEDTVKIKRVSKIHTTYLQLKKDSGYIEIESDEGVFKISLKIVAFNIKDDIITIAYSLTEDVREIEIKYLGV